MNGQQYPEIKAIPFLISLQYPDVRDERDPTDPSLAGLYNRPDYISPLDDLAFDMYQDPEIAQIIRKLEKKKQDAVLGNCQADFMQISFYLVLFFSLCRREI
jgi:hypothetical protein